MNPAFRRISARTSGDDEVIAGLERLGRKTRLFEARGIGPFSGKLLRRPVFIRDGQIEPSVRILELEGDDVAFERNFLFLEIIGRERVMG
jgi:hypothetical protein